MPDRTTHQDATTACRHLGRQIRALRESRGLSDRDLAVEAGMLTTTVVAIEAGWDSIPIGTIARVANALGCELSITPQGATVTPIADRLRRNEPTNGDRVTGWGFSVPGTKTGTLLHLNGGDGVSIVQLDSGPLASVHRDTLRVVDGGA